MPERDTITDRFQYRLPTTRSDGAVAPTTAAHPEHRLERLIERLPAKLRAAVQWLRLPSSRWARIPAGILLIGGGVLSILPLLGLWMLPLGLILLAEDVPLLRRGRHRLLDWLERRRPHWFAGRAPGDTPDRNRP